AAAGGQIAGPWGAAIGGLVGAGAGLLGAASAQKQAAEAQRQASQAAYVSLLQLNVQAGTSSPRALAVVQAHDAANALADAIDKALPGLKNQTEREKELAQVRADEVIIVAKLNAAAAEEIKQGDASVEARRLYALGLKVEGDALTRRMAEEKEVFDAQQAGWSAARIAALQAVQALEDLAAAAQAFAAQVAANLSSQQNSQLRIFNATGQSDAAFAMQQQLELDQAIAQGLDDISIALLKQAQGAELAQREQQKQTDALNKQVSASQDQLRTAEQSLAALQQIHDNLQAFGASLKLGQFSTLSPAQQLAEARNQVTSAYQKALGGDQAAAQQFPSLAQSFLQSSRGYNASGAGYVMDFNSVSVMTDALTQAFGDQMTDQEKVIKALKDQIDLLTKQLAELEGINKGVGDLAQIAMRNFDPTANLPPGIGVDNPHVPNPDPVGTPRPSGPGPSPGTPVTPSNPGRPAIGTPSSSDFAVAVLQDGFSQLIDQVSSLATSQADLARETRIGFQALRAS
ncbi:MAG TPA: hypothetical protein VN903_28690, partial [Polyangia bacterium]|nr:hypothetical protein [Polyangia bacterium]